MPAKMPGSHSSRDRRRPFLCFCCCLQCGAPQGTYQISFRIDHEASVGPPGERRRLASVPGAREAPGQWGGYDLQRTDPQDLVNKAELLGQRSVDRFVGPRPGANRVLGGMMLYLHRQGVNLTDFCSQPRVSDQAPLCSEMREQEALYLSLEM